MSIWNEVEKKYSADDIWEQVEQEVSSGGGGMEEFGKGLVSSTIGVAKELVVQGLSDVISAPGEYLAFVSPQYAKAASEVHRKELVAPLATAKRRMTIAQAKFKQTHKGVAAWAGRAIGEAIPYMATAMVGGLTVGPIGAGIVGFSVEGGQAYEAAKKSGATEAQAQLERGIVGSINAVIEGIQIGRLMKFQTAGRHSIQGLTALVKKKAYGKMAKAGVKFTGTLLKHSFEEGLEEFLQEGVSFAVPANLRNEMPRRPDGSPDLWAIGSQLGGAALGGMFAGGILGGAGAVSIDANIRQKVADLTKSLTPEQRNEVLGGVADKAIEDDPDMTIQEKLSAKFILGNIRYNLERGLVSKLVTNDIELINGKSMAEVGNDIAKALGIKDKINWQWSKRKTKETMATHMGPLADGSHNIRLYNENAAFSGVDRQMELRRTIVHELGHMGAKPTTKQVMTKFPKSAKIKKHATRPEAFNIVYKNKLYTMSAPNIKTAKEQFIEWFGVRRSIHHKKFKKWVADNILILEPTIKETLNYDKPVSEAHLEQEAEQIGELGLKPEEPTKPITKEELKKIKVPLEQVIETPHELGSCMLAAENYAKNAIADGEKDVTIVEGWVDFGEEEQRSSHTWIKKGNKIIDPTKDQFKQWGFNPDDIVYQEIKKEYTPQEYLKLAKKYPVSEAQAKKGLEGRVKYSSSGAYYVLGRNTKEGEGAWRISYFNAEGKGWTHKDFKTKKEADEYFDLVLAGEEKPITEAQAKPKKRSKKALLALGHKIPKEAGLSDAERRAFIEDLTGKRSLKNLTKSELEAVVELMEEEMGTVELKPEDMQKPIQVAGETTTMAKVMASAAEDVETLPDKAKVPERVTKKFARKRGRGLAKTLKSILWGEENEVLHHLTAKLGPTFSDVIGDNIALHSYKIQSGHSQSVFDYFRMMMAENKISDSDLARMSKSQNPRFRLVQAIQEMRGTGTDIKSVEINGKTFDVTMAELMEFYLIAGQEAGFRHIMEGGLVINTVETGVLDEDTITELTQMVEEDAQAITVVNAMQDIGTNIWTPSINNTSQRLESKDIAVIPNWWGLEVYYPTKLGGKQERFNMNLIENRRIFKDRTKSNRPLVIRDAFQRFSVFESAISEYVGYAESTRVARTLINNPDISTALDQKGYGDTRKRIMTILDRAQSMPRDQGAFGKFMKERLPGLYRAYLYFNPRVIVSQATSAMNYGAYVSPKYMIDITKGLTPESIKRTLDMSTIAYDRFYMGHSSLALGEAARSDAVLRMFSHKSSDANKLGITLRIADMAALSGGLEIAVHEYQDAQANKIDGDSAIYWADKNTSFEEGSADWQREVVTRAEWLWQRSQPSWDKWNRSMTTSGLVRQVFFPFRTFHEKSLNVIKEANLEYDRSNKTWHDRGRKAKKWGAVLSSYTLNAIIRAALLGLARRKLKEPWQYVSDLLEAPLSMFPILGTILKNSIGNFINVLADQKLEFHGEAIEAFPARIINLIAQAPADFSIAAGHMINGDTEEAKKAFQRAVKKVYEGVGTSEGVPVSEMKRVYRGWVEDEEEPTTGRKRARRVRPRKVRARR